MAADEFGKVELPAIEQLQSLGWSYVKGEDLSPEKSSERSSFKEVVLEKRLSAPFNFVFYQVAVSLRSQTIAAARERALEIKPIPKAQS